MGVSRRPTTRPGRRPTGLRRAVAPALAVAVVCSVLAGPPATASTRPEPPAPGTPAAPGTPSPPAPARSTLPPAPAVPVSVDPVGFAPGARDPGGVREARTDRPLRLVAVTWNGPSPDTVDLRSTDAAGRWGGWTALDPAGSERDDAPARRPHGGTDPIWVGERDAVEVRALRDGVPVTDGVQVVRIDPGVGANDEALARAARAPGPPPVVSRAQWGADERMMSWPPVVTPSTRAVTIHHTAESNDYGPADSAAIVRGIYAYHARVQDWGDIGYNALVDKFGTVFEGRAGGLDRAVTAAHAGGFNEGTFGIAMMGNLSGVAPTPPQFDAVAALAAWKLAPGVRDPDQRVSLVSAGGGTSRYPAGRTAVVPALFAHRDVGNTVCPGDAAYGAMGALRARVRDLLARPTPDVRRNTGAP